MNAPIDRAYCTTLFGCEAYPSCSYYLYVPKSFGTDRQPARYRLAVLLSGVDRIGEQYRNAFKAFAEATQTALVAPLFPATLGQPLGTYSLADPGGMRYDRALLAMLAELGDHFPVDVDRFLLHGFSCGGQFAHRFLYLHPHRLSGVSIGAPGAITLLDKGASWPEGTGNFEALFGAPMALEAMRNVPVQIVIGREDVVPFVGNIARVDNAEKLLANYSANGLNAVIHYVENVGHYGIKLVEAAESFFRSLR